MLYVNIYYYYQQKEYSLKHSKILKSFIEQNKILNLNTKYKEEQIQQLCQIKGIKQGSNKFYVKKIFKEYMSYKYAVSFLEEKRKVKYDKQNHQHEKMLFNIWENLLGNEEKLQKRVTEQWIKIGFQGSDPATDFRGAGWLGLFNLYKFTQNQLSKGVFKWAIHKQTQYFFCSAGLFFTMLSMQLVKQMLVHVDYWVIDQKQQKQMSKLQEQNLSLSLQQNDFFIILNKFQLIYNMLFIQFHQYWKKCKNKSIMEFNINLLNFKTQIKSFSVVKIKEKLIYYKDLMISQ